MYTIGKDFRFSAAHFTDHFSTVFGALDPAELAAWILHERLGVRIQVQLHRILWDPLARCV